jgi:hypothetical protein
MYCNFCLQSLKGFYVIIQYAPRYGHEVEVPRLCKFCNETCAQEYVSNGYGAASSPISRRSSPPSPPDPLEVGKCIDEEE